MFLLIEKSPSVEDFMKLRKAAGMPSRSIDGVHRGINNSLFSVIIIEEKENLTRTVGMGRIIGDGGTVYHICDMVVLPELQDQGLGSMMMDSIMNYIRKKLRNCLKISKFRRKLNSRLMLIPLILHKF